MIIKSESSSRSKFLPRRSPSLDTDQDLVCRCDRETQKLIADQTFEDLITTQNGMTISRALVNVVIDQQIGQQISVSSLTVGMDPCA